MIDILFDLAGAVFSGREMNESMRESDRRKDEAIKKSNSATLGRVAGIAAMGAVAAFGISQLADNKNNQNKGGVKRA